MRWRPQPVRGTASCIARNDSRGKTTSMSKAMRGSPPSSRAPGDDVGPLTIVEPADERERHGPLVLGQIGPQDEGAGGMLSLDGFDRGDV